MSQLMHLEEFEETDGTEHAPKLAPVAPEEFESQVKAAYEQGYAAGWDDAIEEETKANERIGAEFARNLRDLGFTFHEARNQVLSTMEGLLQEIANSLMPELVRQNLGPHLVQEILAMASGEADCVFEILVPCGSLSLVEPYLEPLSTLQVTAHEEPSLAAGQALIRAAQKERGFDFDTYIQNYSAAVAALFDHVRQERANG